MKTSPTEGSVGRNPFDTSAKAVIRKFDYEILEKFKKENYPDQALRYLGLPGAELLDVLAWREFIGPWTGVQIDDSPDRAEEADELELNVMRNNLERDFQLVRADLDDLIANDHSRKKLMWPYQIVNLDYVGGLVHKRDNGTSRRLETIKRLFDSQHRTKFVLFVTLNLRDKDDGEFDTVIADLEKNLVSAGCSNVEERFEKHREFGNAGRLKLYFPVFLSNNVPEFELTFSPPILYEGSKQMMHFVVECHPFRKAAGGALFSVTGQVACANLPLLTCDSNQIMRRDDLGSAISLPKEDL